MTIVQRLLSLDWKAWACIAFGFSALLNYIIDKGFKVPADHSPEWKAWNLQHPRAAGLVNMARGLIDVIKFAVGLVQTLTADPKHDASSTFPGPGPDDGSLE